MRKYLFIIFIAFIAIYSIFSIIATVRVLQITTMDNKMFVPEKTLLAIENGSTLDQVRKTLGNAARHEFTVTRPNGTYTFISCLGPDPDGNRIGFLFHDQVLEKMVYPLGPVVERVPYQGTTASRVKSWDINDQTRITKTIAAPPLPQAQLLSDLQPYDGKGESWSLVPAALVVGAVTSGPFQFRYMERAWNEHKVNLSYLSRYDGCNASLGITGEEIEAIFGKPLRVFSSDKGEHIRIYGQVGEFEVRPSIAFKGMAVVNDAQDRVIAVYSDQYFDDSWAGRSEPY
jgi:hypothetical protein